MKRACNIGEGIVWRLKRCLPGQRNAATRWYEHLRSILERLGFEFSQHVPGLARHKTRAVWISIHVDDELLAGQREDSLWLVEELEKVFRVEKEGPYPWLGDLKVLDCFISDLLEDTEGGCGYLEALSLSHKCRGASNSRGLRMHLVVPTKGIGPRPWGKDFLAVARECGRDLEQLKSGEPLLFLPDVHGGLSNTPADTDRFAGWARDLLCNLPGYSGDRITGHSAKATALSWMGKSGTDYDTQTILGHHVLVGRKSALTYARDTQAAPVRKFESLLGDIRRGVFLPDSTRSGRFALAGGVGTVDADFDAGLRGEPRGGVNPFTASAENSDAVDSFSFPQSPPQVLRASTTKKCHCQCLKAPRLRPVRRRKMLCGMKRSSGTQVLSRMQAPSPRAKTSRHQPIMVRTNLRPAARHRLRGPQTRRSRPRESVRVSWGIRSSMTACCTDIGPLALCISCLQGHPPANLFVDVILMIRSSGLCVGASTLPLLSASSATKEGPFVAQAACVYQARSSIADRLQHTRVVRP